MSLVSLQPIKAILFDLDGTLVHSSLDFKQIRQDISCPESEDVLTYIASLSLNEREIAEKTIVQHELNDARTSTIIPGAIRLLTRLDDHGLKMGIITRNSAEATNIKMERCGLNIDEVLTREDAPAKPDPSGLLYFSDLWGFSPNECVYVGDYLYDIQAANNADMHACLYLNNGLLNQAPYYAQQADFICKDFDFFENDVRTYLASV